MCIICELVKMVEDKEGQDTELVGVVNEQLQKDFTAYVVARDNDELDIEQIVLDTRRAYVNDKITEAEVDAKQDEVSAMQEAFKAKYDEEFLDLWNRIYEDLAIVGEERDRDYTYNRESGEVTAKKRQGLRTVYH